MYKMSLHWTEGTVSQHNVQIRLKVTVNHVLLMLKVNNYGLTYSMEASMVGFCGTYTNVPMIYFLEMVRYIPQSRTVQMQDRKKQK